MPSLPERPGGGSIWRNGWRLAHPWRSAETLAGSPLPRLWPSRETGGRGFDAAHAHASINVRQVCLSVLSAEIQEEQFFEELPTQLRVRIVQHMLHGSFASWDVFGVLPAPARRRLAACVSPVTLLPGHDLCGEGEPVDCLWILQEGSVMALAGGSKVGIISAPGVLGEGTMRH
jgi:hypothetical protein